MALLGTAALVLLVTPPAGTIAWQQGIAGVLALGSVWAILALLDRLVPGILRLEQDHAPSFAKARSVALLGKPIACREVAELFAACGSPVTVIGMFGALDPERSRNQPRSGNFSHLLESVRARNVDEVVIVPSGLDDSHVAGWIEQLMIYPVDISIAPVSLPGSLSGIHRLGSMPCVPLVKRPVGKRAAIGKRLLDVALATIGLVGLAPLLVLTMLAIKLELAWSGPFSAGSHRVLSRTVPDVEIPHDASP